ncbi:MAG: peptidylprolyl isomerase [Bacteroidales bacterium]|jgi:peptidyl-prolyl cis-trans isomerase SurA|nr:peptidylprolyl isomerase [Bacteroidales bacterium]
MKKSIIILLIYTIIETLGANEGQNNVIFSVLQADSNKIILDEIVASIGSRIITTSDLEFATQAQQYQMGLHNLSAEDENRLRCAVFEKLVLQKLLVDQAELDSIVITDAQLNERLDYNLRYQLAQMGNDSKKLEEYYGKSIAEIKADSREQLREELLADEAQKTITSKINIIYQEVKQYYESIPADSLPILPAEYEIAHIVKTPKVSDAEKIAAKERLEELRDRSLKGENFTTFARMYSEDPGSASRGGEIGFTGRGELYTEFENVAYGLQPGEISPVVETKAGYHIIRMIERRGDRINVAHILIKPKPSPEETSGAKDFLDSIYNLLANNELSFDSAAKIFSDDPSKTNYGKLVNPYTASYSFDSLTLLNYDKTLFYTVQGLDENKYSRPIPMITEDGNQAYHIVCLKVKHPSHIIDMSQDYEKIKNAALENKKENALDKWAKNKVKYTHVKINSKYYDCSFVTQWNVPTKINQ